MDNESAFIDTASFVIKRPRLLNAVFIQLLTGFFIGGAVAFFMIYNKYGFIPNDFIYFFLVFITALVVIAFVAAVLMRPKHDLKIEFHPGHIALPSKTRSSRVFKVPYRDINSVVGRGNKKRKYLIIGTKKRAFIYNLAHFKEPVTCDHFLEILGRYLAAQPDGERLWQGIKERGDIFNKSMKPKVAATWGIFAVIAAVFIIEIFLGVLNNEMVLLELGANASALVRDGEWYRLFNSNFLHLNFYHIYFNVIFLLLVGVGVERLAGIWNFTFIYLFSALGGALASTLMSSAMFSIGASTAMYGLLGALAVINIKYRGKLPVGYRIPRNNWILLILLTVLFKFIFPQIDDWAHAGGFITGCVLTYIIYRKRTEAVISTKPVKLVQALTVVIAAFFLFGAMVSVNRFKRGNNPGLVRLAELYDAVPDTNPGALNSIAWNIVTQRQENKEVVGFARRLAEKAVSQKEDSLEYRDTLATAYFMSGDDERAIGMERKILARVEKRQNFYATQLACFAANNYSSACPIIIGNDINPGIHFYSEWTGEGEEKHLDIKADIKGDYRNMVAYLTQSRNGVNFGVIRFKLNNPQQKSFVFKTKIKDPDADYRLRVLMIDTSEDIPETSAHTWRYWFLDKKTLKIYREIFGNSL